MAIQLYITGAPRPAAAECRAMGYHYDTVIVINEVIKSGSEKAEVAGEEAKLRANGQYGR